MQLTLAGFQYFLDLIKERREAADPGNDFIGSPVSASDNGDSLNDYQIVSIIQAVIVAGSDTATDLHTYAIKGLLSNPQQYALLREKPELMENAILELLRVGAFGKTPQFSFVSEDQIGRESCRERVWQYV